jgi:hypothetical protein
MSQTESPPVVDRRRWTDNELLIVLVEVFVIGWLSLNVLAMLGVWVFISYVVWAGVTHF